MSAVSLLSPSGTPFVELGGERCWRQRTIRDVVCSYQWVELYKLGDESAPREPEPCMCLFPAHRRMDTGAYCIPQRLAYLYVTSEGKPTEHLLRKAFEAAEAMGYTAHDRSTIHRIIDIIEEGLPDLIMMPTDQPAALATKRRLIGVELAVKAHGQELHSEVI
ncbi:hypothetical protein [Comamonas sp.]|uniref:hypothetical protein n=1 Tax=Comamonas sp. TaxID=34028 RepID=UPI0028976C2B|nr:hypothetical protein [Comamonas sp.]